MAQPADAIRTITVGTGTAEGVAFSPEGGKLYVASGETVFAYDLASGAQISAWDLRTEMNAIDVSPDGHTLTVLSNFADIIPVDTATGATGTGRGYAPGYYGIFKDVAYAGNGEVIIAASSVLSNGALYSFDGSHLTSIAGGGGTLTLYGSADKSEVLASSPTSGDTIYSAAGLVSSRFTASSGFGAHALAPSQDLVLLMSTGLNVYNMALVPQVDLQARYPSLTSSTVSGLAFSPSGDKAYVLDVASEAVFALSTSDWGVTASYHLPDAPLDTALHGDNLLASGHYLSIVTATGVDVIDLATAQSVGGTSENDTLSGDAGATTFYGFEGNDLLSGGAGTNVLDGGPGIDTVSYAGAATGVTVDLSLTGAQATGISTDTITNIENLTGSAHADTLTGDAHDNVIDGGGGADIIDAGAGNDRVLGPANVTDGGHVTVNGGAGTDTLDFSASPGETIIGRNGDTLFYGAAGTAHGFERLIGSSAGDHIELQHISETVGAFSYESSLEIFAGGGNDYVDNEVTAAGATVIVHGGDGDDILIATGDMFGDAGNDLLAPVGAGARTIDGGAGSDTLRVTGGEAVDLAAGTFGAGATHLLGIENVAISFAGASVRGDEGANILDAGNASGSQLFGGGGNDVLIGGNGIDSFSGGDGADSVQGTRATLNGDSITDLAVGDRIVFTDATLSGFAATLDGGTLHYGDGQSLTIAGGFGGRLVAEGVAGGGVALVATAGPPSAADFDGNAHSDFLWRNTNGAVSTWTVSGDGHQVQQGAYNGYVDTSWHISDTLDFNGDGRADILYRQSGGAVAVWDSTGGGFDQSSYYLADPVPTDWRIAGTGDVTGDGKDDLIWQRADGVISTWNSTGTGFQEAAYNHGSVGTAWQVEGLADFNGDGLGDILWRNTDGSVSTWLNDARGGFVEGSYYFAGVPTSWHIDGTGDFDGDGKADLLWRNDNGAVSEWRSNGNGFDQSVYNSSAPTDWHIAATGDFNDDGRADILFHNDDGRVSTWQSNGAGFDQSIYNAAAPTDWSIAAHQFVL